MNLDKLKDILDKIPIGLLVFVFLGYLGWDYFQFDTSIDSPLTQKKSELEAVRKETQSLNQKVKAAKEFFRTLEQKREELRKLAQHLEDLKGTVSSEIDVPGFMKTVLTEAKRVGINVYSIKPAPIVTSEYYEEHPFDLGFRGVYVQLVVFLEHLSNIQNVVRVDNLDIHPVGNSSSKYVELEGVVQIKTFKYLGTKADSLGAPSQGSGKGGAQPAGKPGTSGSGPASKEGP